ncbi:hypothetical protein [Nocardia farcinica]
MNEKLLHPQGNSGEQPPDERADTAPSAEPDDDREQHLTRDVSEALLRAVYNAVERSGKEVRSAAVTVAIEVVQTTHSFDPRSADDRQALAVLADYVADRIVELTGAYEELTTSDLQGAVEALALRLVHNQLPVDGAEQTEGGDHE